jgi:iron complex outermembrane recepter protein
MKRNILFFTLVFFETFSQRLPVDSLKNLSEIVVSATRTQNGQGMAFTNISKASLQKQNLGQDMPILLQSQPSVTVSSDAGAGIGYTGIRIRGTDPTRINVSVNGIPYNDSESQGVYWVNMPDIASSTQSIQIQRGVGSSTNGAGAFGGSINLNTLGYQNEPGLDLVLGLGSFGTKRASIQASSGLIKKGYIFDLRLSALGSEGFVDRASSNLKSFYSSVGKYKGSSFIRLNIFSGKEITYQSWNGIPIELAQYTVNDFQKYAERNFVDEKTAQNMLRSGRTFNFYNYENEVDNYAQTHFQLISALALKKGWRFNPALHYTRGLGYFEQYKYGQSLVTYGAEKYGNIDTDLARRKYLDNHFLGAVWSLENAENLKNRITWGGGLNQYLGGHYGKIVKTEEKTNIPEDFRWYENNSVKTDFNSYFKVFSHLGENWTSYVDMQYRYVGFRMQGLTDVRKNIDYDNLYHFFNPKLGVNYAINKNSNLYVSYAKASKEPSRQDFVDQAPKVPKPEKLHDIEMGYKVNQAKYSFEANFYNMYYKDQLVLTGAINNVGEAIRTNIDRSYRRGIELMYAVQAAKAWYLSLNTTFSQNKVIDFKETIVSYGTAENKINSFKSSDISFSPAVIAGGIIQYKPKPSIEISLLPKFVSRQFLDNTSSIEKSLDAYFVNDLRVLFTPQKTAFKNATWSVLVNNIFNHEYESNGYTYSYLLDNQTEVYRERFVYPQAGINFLMSMKWSFKK